jgi:hypothetical protein
MPDWQQLVRLRLGPLGLEPAREEEIVHELAHHLEDLYEESLAHDLTEREAVEKALASVEDWSAVRRNIRRAELGHPAALPVLVLVILPVLLVAADCSFRRLLDPSQTQLASFITVAVVGALLVLVSRVAGGRPRDQVFAALLPIASIAAIRFASSLSVSYIYDGSLGFLASVRTLCAELVVPWLALVAGGILGSCFSFLWVEPAPTCAAVSGMCAARDTGPAYPHPFSSRGGQSVSAMAATGVPWVRLAFALPVFFISLGALDDWLHGPAAFARVYVGPLEVRFSVLQLAVVFLLGIFIAAPGFRLGGDHPAQMAVALLPPTWWFSLLLFWALNSLLQIGRHLSWVSLLSAIASTVVLPAFAMCLGPMMVTLGRRCLRFSLLEPARGS